MCGIAGFNWQDKDLAEQMVRSLRHRGPDDSGYYLDNNISLGHSRLSIIDTSSKGHQPMHFENLAIIYNGEVYNFRELKEQLIAKGYQFKSHTDTEVILYSYHCWGRACVERFNGMWAFCIYDKRENTLFLSRDRFGVKPLYYYFDGDRFIFASELKAIRKYKLDLKLNTAAVNFFFYQKYIGGELTIFENCFKLKPSECLTFDMKYKKLIKWQYYDLEEKTAEAAQLPVQQRLDSAEQILTDAVLKRLVADVPVGSFLSGGIDSSLISAIIAKNTKDFDTFSIGFEDESYDETEFSSAVAEHIGTAHHIEKMNIDEQLMEYLISMMDEPFGDSSLLPTYLLSKMTRRKVTVALSGDAGDEVFGGYDSYKAHQLSRYIPQTAVRAVKPFVNLLPPSEKKLTLGFKIKKFVNDFHPDQGRRHLDWMSTFADGQRKDLLSNNFMAAETIVNWPKENGLLAAQLNDIHNYLAEDILKKVDLASMLNSLETRTPFLDYRLVPLILSLPPQYKIRRLTTKYLLKQIAKKYIPDTIINRPKRGFTVPVSRWIKQSGLIREYLTNRRHFETGIINHNYVKQLFDNHIQNKQDNARQLWLVFVFNYWMK